MSQGAKQFPTRIPVALHAALAAAATENNRSLNAEVIYRLDQTFQENPDCPPVAVDLLVTAAANAVATVVTEVITTCFTRLEERMLEKLAPEMLITSVHIDASDADVESLRAAMKATGNYGELSTLHQRLGLQLFDFTPGNRQVSPTGRLSESQPEISGINTLPQALPGRRHLITPGALEWDRPGEETSWRIHDGLNPIGLCISADTIVEVERRDGVKLPADRAGDFNWIWDASLLPGKDPAEIYAWRLVPGQAEYPEGWIENTGTPPVGSKVRVDLKYRNGHTLTDVRAGNIDWYNNLSHPVDEDITHWRHAK